MFPHVYIHLVYVASGVGNPNRKLNSNPKLYLNPTFVMVVMMVRNVYLREHRPGGTQPWGNIDPG